MKRLLTILLIIFPVVAASQQALDDYVVLGLSNNLALKQKEISYRKSLEALREARGLFYPNLSLGARYTVADGGRVIDLPIGTMLNPVYSTLNALTSSNSFPMTGDMQIRFLRPTEHETRLRLTQPLFNTSVYYNAKIRRELSVLESEDVAQYRRELKAEIKKAYYNAASADGVLKMLTATRKLLTENIRVNRKLIENGKATYDYLYRSEAELGKFDQELRSAVKNREVASAYFNFLLNRPLGDSIVFMLPDKYPSLSGIAGNYAEVALANREEISRLKANITVTGLEKQLYSSAYLPDLFMVVDYGYQGEKYRFNRENDYMIASAVMTWNIFSGFQKKARVKEAALDSDMAAERLEEVKKQIELQVLSVLSELSSAEQGMNAAEARLRNAREGFRLVNRKYEEGQASLLEFIDARVSMTQAEENLIISRFAYLSAFAEFEKTIAINGEEGK